MSENGNSTGRATLAPEVIIRQHWLSLRSDLDRITDSARQGQSGMHSVKRAMEQIQKELHAPSGAGAQRAKRLALTFRRTDPWERRLSQFLSQLDARGRNAFGLLVTLGLNPDILADVVTNYAQDSKSTNTDKALRAFRSHLASISKQCRDLAESFEQLLCQVSDLAFAEQEHLLPAYLRQRADYLRTLRDSLDPRRQSTERHIAVLGMVSQVVAAENLSGGRQEALFVDVLNAMKEAHGRPPVTPDALRKLVERQLSDQRPRPRPRIQPNDSPARPLRKVTAGLVITPVEFLRPIEMPRRRSERTS